jgi:hypothetical protein
MFPISFLVRLKYLRQDRSLVGIKKKGSIKKNSDNLTHNMATIVNVLPTWNLLRE